MRWVDTLHRILERHALCRPVKVTPDWTSHAVIWLWTDGQTNKSSSQFFWSKIRFSRTPPWRGFSLTLTSILKSAPKHFNPRSRLNFLVEQRFTLRGQKKINLLGFLGENSIGWSVRRSRRKYRKFLLLCRCEIEKFFLGLSVHDVLFHFSFHPLSLGT
jgi:hypothetical protein